ncbi:hypothetical protein Sm713_51910 [Streptomyces sp. TS71-3]|nr:hypothetical protein Sm713_51910 [Streptomyces sp. TS71-3]
MGVPPGRAKPSVGESATDDNAADVRAGPREPSLIQTKDPRQTRPEVPAPCAAV